MHYGSGLSRRPMPAATDSSNKSAKVNSMVQLIGKWNSATWKLHSWPGQTQAENDTSQHQSEPTNSLPVTLAGEDSVVSAPIIMHFDAGAACSAQPGVNFSATVRTRLYVKFSEH